MTTSHRNAILVTALVMNLASILARAEEEVPKPAVKKAAEAKPAEAEPKADKPADPKKAVDAREAQIDAQIQQWIPQFTQQYRPILTTELNFIRQVCDLTPEQRPKIKTAGEASLKEAALQMAEMQGGRMRGGVRVQNEQPNPQRSIRESVAKALQETLTPEQMTKYKAETTQRTALRKRAAIRCVVARLDGTLCLTADQRDKITQSITAGWQDKWEQWLMLSVYGDQYFPMVPDQHVVTHLDADQKSVWSGLQKIDFGYYGGGGVAEADDGWWGVEPAKADAPKQ